MQGMFMMHHDMWWYMIWYVMIYDMICDDIWYDMWWYMIWYMMIYDMIWHMYAACLALPVPHVTGSQTANNTSAVKSHVCKYSKQHSKQMQDQIRHKDEHTDDMQELVYQPCPHCSSMSCIAPKECRVLQFTAIRSRKQATKCYRIVML